jgi:hypothetical protein
MRQVFSVKTLTISPTAREGICNIVISFFKRQTKRMVMVVVVVVCMRGRGEDKNE